MGQKEAIFMLENNNAVLAVVDPVYPGTALRPGSSGSEVARMQTYLNGLRDAKYPTLNRLVVDGRYGSATASTVMQYQVINRLSMDGVIGHDTWNAIVSDYNATIGGSADTYPGIPLRPGDRSQDVRHMQGRLNEVARIYTGPLPIWLMREDFLQQITEQGMPADYVNTLAALSSNGMLIVLFLAPIVGAVIGGLIARIMFRKHFEKAGLV